MPQVAKESAQLALETRISKCKQLLRHLNASLKSMRARNKADRERQRPQNKLNALNDDIQEAYGNLAGDISTIDRGDTTEADEADEKAADQLRR